MSKIAFIYPGQGAQKAGMGADFYENEDAARQLYDAASEFLSLDMKSLCFVENEWLDQTEYTQAAMVTTCLAMTRVVTAGGIRPDMTAGLSLGEYCAIAAAGGMSEEEAIRTVRIRGILMQNTVPQGEGAMAAILGLTGEQIEAVIADEPDVTIANYNCPGQIVITGAMNAVKAAADKLQNAGAKRAVLLNVSGPFHSPMLKEAGENLDLELAKVQWKELKIPYVTNVTAEVITDISGTRELLAKQVCASVRWQQSMERMIAEGVDTFIEIGPGKTLTGFLKRINRNVNVYQINTLSDVETVKSALADKIER